MIRARSMQIGSGLGSLARSSLAGLVTSRVHFMVKLVKSYVRSALKCCPAPSDRSPLRFRRIVHRAAAVAPVSIHAKPPWLAGGSAPVFSGSRAGLELRD